MAEQYRAKRTSEEISRWDAANYPGGFNRYAEELRNAIERELREWGECPLLERLDRERPYISAPLFEVLRSVHQRQKNEAAPAASGNQSFVGILQQRRETRRRAARGGTQGDGSDGAPVRACYGERENGRYVGSRLGCGAAVPGGGIPPYSRCSGGPGRA